MNRDERGHVIVYTKDQLMAMLDGALDDYLRSFVLPDTATTEDLLSGLLKLHTMPTEKDSR